MSKIKVNLLKLLDKITAIIAALKVILSVLKNKDEEE